MAKNSVIVYSAIIIFLIGVSGYLVLRPPVLEIAPDASVNFEKAIINCSITNKGLFPIQMLSPHFPNSFIIRVIDPNGKDITPGMCILRGYDKSDVITLKHGQSHRFSIDLLEPRSKGVKFLKLRKCVSPKIAAEYTRMIEEEKLQKLYKITTPGNYILQAAYYVDRDFRNIAGVKVWSGRIESQRIAVTFNGR